MTDNREKEIQRKAEDVINSLLDGYCPESLRASILAWLVSDVEQKEKEAAMRAVFDKRVNYEEKPGAWSLRMVRQWLKRPAVKREFDMARRSAGRRRPFGLMPALRVAAVVLPFLVVAGASFWTYRDGLKVQYVAPVAMVTVAVSGTSDAKGCTRLCDGSGVFITPGSEIAYAEDFGAADKRRVKLKGEAYFSVATDSIRPFVVETERMNINVLGTTFDVSSVPGQPLTTVTLYTGRIRIDGLQCEGAGEITMAPGQRMIYDNATCRYRIEHVDEELPGWIAEKLDFRHLTLGEIFDRIGWYYGVEVDSEGPVSDDVYSFLLSGREDLDTAMALVEDISLDFTYRIEGDTVFVTKHTY